MCVAVSQSSLLVECFTLERQSSVRPSVMFVPSRAKVSIVSPLGAPLLSFYLRRTRQVYVSLMLIYLDIWLAAVLAVVLALMVLLAIVIVLAVA